MTFEETQQLIGVTNLQSLGRSQDTFVANKIQGAGSRTKAGDVPFCQCGAVAAVFEPEGKATGTAVLVPHC